MSFMETASTFDDAGRSRIDVSWKGDAMSFGADVVLARRSGAGEIEPVKEVCKSLLLLTGFSLSNLCLLREGSPQLVSMIATRRNKAELRSRRWVRFLHMAGNMRGWTSETEGKTSNIKTQYDRERSIHEIEWRVQKNRDRQNGRLWDTVSGERSRASNAVLKRKV